MPTLNTVNDADHEGFVALLGGVFEHTPWVAERAWRLRPFASLDTLHKAMMDTVRKATADEQLALLRAHPELAGREAVAGTLTADSTSEQGRLGFTALDHGEFERIADINRRYRNKFGIPCIVALRLHATRAIVLSEMERRLANDTDTEISNAIDQIGHITWGRLESLLGGT
jgi:OHCU decarboxylase